jgi:hypothetical protein
MARRVVVSELLSARRVATYGSVRGKELRRLLAHLTKNTDPEAPVDLSECFLNLANDVLCRVAFGRRFPHGKDDKLAAVLAEAQDLFAGFTIGDFFPELEKLARTARAARCWAWRPWRGRWCPLRPEPPSPKDPNSQSSRSPPAARFPLFLSSGSTN